MATIEQRIAKLEAATQKNEFRPFPLSRFYGEPLAAQQTNS